MGVKARRYLSLLLIFIIILILLINYNAVESSILTFLEGQISTLGYVGIFITVFFLELVPQPIVSPLLPMITGIYFGFNYLNLLYIVLISSIISNYTAYFFGKIYGEPIVRFFMNERNYQRSIRWFDKHGKIGITLLALTPLPYFPVIGGIFKMKLHEFTLFAIIPRILHFIIFSYIILLAI
ncbi:hypothetical protein CMI42_00330 [Candidatus Pacearchaeota archaeon]|nr:hypothetical protein [Candidatus Pacearchaeota archaeon]